MAFVAKMSRMRMIAKHPTTAFRSRIYKRCFKLSTPWNDHSLSHSIINGFDWLPKTYSNDQVGMSDDTSNLSATKVFEKKEIATPSIRKLCSSNNLTNILNQNLTISKEMSTMLRITPMRTIIDEVTRSAKAAMDSAHQRKKTLNQEDYRLLLSLAEQLGNDRLARDVWARMNEDGVEATVECYNHFLGAHVWNDLLPEYRHFAINTEFNKMARSTQFAGGPYSKYTCREHGMKDLVKKLLADMLRHNIRPTEETICHILVGFAREGDIKGFDNLLRNTWKTSGESFISFAKSSPSRVVVGNAVVPTQKLLKTICFCCCINNDLTKAVNLIETLSTSYKIDIPLQIWEDLVDWAYILTKKSIPGESGKYRLKKTTVLGMWQALSKAPYNLTPTLRIYDRLIRAMWLNSYSMQMWNTMQSALSLFEDQKRTEMMAWTKLKGHNRNDTSVDELKSARQHVDSLGLTSKRNSQYLKSWLRLLFAISRHECRQKYLRNELCHVIIPCMFKGRWSRFLPSKIRYYIPTGLVTITRISDREILRHHITKQILVKNQVDLLVTSGTSPTQIWAHRPYENKRLDKLLYEQPTNQTPVSVLQALPIE